MKYLTKEWHLGKISDRECQKREKENQRYFRENIKKFPVDFILFAEKESLHDALFEKCEIDRIKNSLSLDLICGENTKGYHRLTLVYLNVNLKKLAIDILNKLVNSKDAELLYDEIDMNGEFFVHRMLFWPTYTEIAIFFRDFKFNKINVTSRKRALIRRRFKEIL